MGVTIHYRGRLNDVGQLPILCEELADIAAAMGWRSTSLDDDWEQPADARLRITLTGAEIDGNLGLKGIEMSPGPKCESLSFFFDREGNLRCPMSMVAILDGTINLEQAWVSVKTQFAPPEIHAWIIGLLKYLKKRHIADLQVSDEGEYWETGDINILKDRMNLINEGLDRLESALSADCLGDGAELSAEEIASRIEQLLRDKGKNGIGFDLDGDSDSDPEGMR